MTSPGMFVCHRCDNRPCWKPDHLFLGTVADNNRDMFVKGRGHALRPDLVAQIYELTDRGMTQKAISLTLGIPEGTISGRLHMRRKARS